MKAADSAESEVLEIEIHGYLDGELNEERTAKIEEYLDRDRPAAERLVHYGVQGDLIRRLYGPLINRPMPTEMAGRFQAINERRYHSMKELEPEVRWRRRRQRFLVVFFLVLALFVIGVAAVWFFQPKLLESMLSLIKSLSVDKLSSFWS